MTDHSSQTADQRSEVRHDQEMHLRMRITTPSVGGFSDNISEAGVLFFTEEPVRVELEIQEEDGPRTVTGRLVRVQRMNENSTGMAIEFDRS